MQKQTLNGEYSVHKLRQNLNKSGDGFVVDGDDSISQPSHDHLSSTEDDFPDSSQPLPHSGHKTSHGQPEWRTAVNSLKADSLQSTDSDGLSDELSHPVRHKVVAIDTSKNKHFSRKLLPVQSPEFDNVMDQVIHAYVLCIICS
jgi:hypothetical protein